MAAEGTCLGFSTSISKTAEPRALFQLDFRRFARGADPDSVGAERLKGAAGSRLHKIRREARRGRQGLLSFAVRLFRRRCDGSQQGLRVGVTRRMRNLAQATLLH